MRLVRWVFVPLSLLATLAPTAGCSSGATNFDVPAADATDATPAADAPTDAGDAGTARDARPDAPADTARDATGDAPAADAPAVDAPPVDASDDAATDGATDAGPTGCASDRDCDDHLFCNGAERCVAGSCEPGIAPCDDGRTCTRDACNENNHTCASIPDDARCSDSNACNGVEVCDPTAPGALRDTGCVPPSATPIDCDDHSACTVDSCDTRVGCVHAPMDHDGDGHVSRYCTVTGLPGDPAGDDCDDNDPATYPGAREICDDQKDNNCDGNIDLADVAGCRAGNDVCADAALLSGPGTYTFTTGGLLDDYVLGCNPGTFADAVAQFTLTEPHDVELKIDTLAARTGLAVYTDCASTSLRCAYGSPSWAPDLRFHSLAAGTYYVVVETGLSAQPFQLTYDVTDATPPLTGDTCGDAAVELNDGLPHSVSLTGLADDYVVSCHTVNGAFSFDDAVYRLTLAADADVTLTGSSASGTTWLSLRAGDCDSSASQLQCVSSGSNSSTLTLLQRHLTAGTYWVIAEASDSSASPTVTVTAHIVSPPAPAPLGEACPTSTADPAIDINDGLPHIIALHNYDNDYTLSCNASATGSATRDAVMRLALSAPSDVRVTATAPSGGNTISLRSAACADPTSEIRCATAGTSGSGIVYASALPAGTYWVVVENSDPTSPNVVVTAQVTSPPMAPPADDACPAAPTDGVTDITDGTPQLARMAYLSDNYALRCRTTAATANNAQDAVFRLTLTGESDVDLSAARASSTGSGSVFMSLRRADCADSATEMRCFTGSPGVANTVRNLAAGTYWVIVENSATVADDMVVSATVRPATTRTPGDFCPGVPVAIDAGPTSLSRATLLTGSDIGTTCGTGSNPSYWSTWFDGVFNFTLTDARDVWVTAFPTKSNTSSVYASLQVYSACDGSESSAVSACSTTPSGSTTVTTTTQIARHLGPGTYYAVVDAPGSQAISDLTVQVGTTGPSTGPGTYALSTPTDATFVNACALPGAVTVLPNVTTGTTALIPRSAVPFDLRVYGLDLNPAVAPSFTVSPNGWLSFLPTAVSGGLPSLGLASEPNLFVAPFSRNGVRTNAGGICYAVAGTAPNRQFIVEWNDETVNGTSPLAHLTYEVIVNEAPAGTDNTIDVVYQTLSSNAGAALAGMESEAGSAVAQDLGPFTAPRVVRYTHLP